MINKNENENRLVYPGLYNARDLGGFMTASGKWTAFHRFIRSDEPSALTEKDLDMLLTYPIRTVIDLRSEGEIQRKRNPFKSHSDILFTNISLFDADPDNENDPTVQVAIRHSLGELYIHLLKTRQPQIAEVFRFILRAPDGAILFHCTLGKDRTGIVAALLLSLVQVSHEDIINNYAVTYDFIRSIVDPKIALMTPETQHILESDAENMKLFLQYLDDSFEGSALHYLTSIGFSDQEIQELQTRILA